MLASFSATPPKEYYPGWWLNKPSWTNTSASRIVNHLVRARSTKVFEENHHLSRDTGTTCSFVTCDFFRGYCWNLPGINHTQKWINPKKKGWLSPAWAKLWAFKIILNPGRGTPPPLPPSPTPFQDLASMVTSLGLLVKSFFFAHVRCSPSKL